MQKKRLRELSWVFTAAGGATNGISIWVTYEGLLVISGNPPFSAALATVAGLIGFLVTFVASQVWPWVPPRKLWKALLGLAIGFVAIGAGSTSIATVGMAAPQAQRLEMRDTLDQAERQLETLEIQAKDQSKAAGWLEAEADRVQLSAEEERQHGPQVRKGKRSRSAQDLDHLAQAYREAAELLEADDQRRARAAMEANKTLAQLRVLVDQAQANAPELRRVQQPYLKKLRQLNLSLAELRRSALDDEPLTAVRQVLATQQDLPVKLRKDSKSSAGPLTSGEKRNRRKAATKRQQEEQAALSAMHERQLRTLDALDRRLQNLRGPQLPPAHLQRISDLEAVVKHRRAVSHLIALPICLDFAVPLMAMMFLGLFRTSTQDPKPLHHKLPPAVTYATPSARQRLAQVMARGQRTMPGPGHSGR